MTLSLKDLCYYLNFDEATWNTNKGMLGYIQGEKYEEFLYRKHGFKHTDQNKVTNTIAAITNDRIKYLEAKLEKTKKRIIGCKTIIRNMEDILIKKVKGCSIVRSRPQSGDHEQVGELLNIVGAAIFGRHLEFLSVISANCCPLAVEITSSLSQICS